MIHLSMTVLESGALFRFLWRGGALDLYFHSSPSLYMYCVFCVLRLKN
jgi:hypothetical protein